MLERRDFYDIAASALDACIRETPQPVERYGIRVTSGTTGREPLVFASQYEEFAYERYASVSAPIICYGSMCSRLTNATFFRFAKTGEDARVLVLDNVDITQELSTLLAEFKPDSLFGFVSFVARVAEHIGEKTAAEVKLLRLGGEQLTAGLEMFFKNKFPNARITMAFVVKELGQITTDQCAYMQRNFYHPAPDVRIDIREPDASGAGDILVSKEIYPGVHIEQYRTGDIGRLSQEPCPCGASQKLEILGRSGFDYVKLVGAMLRRDEFDRVSGVLATFDDYRAEASSVVEDGTLKGRILLRIYSAKGPGTEALAKEIANNFSRAVYLTPTQTLYELVQKGLFLPLEVRFERVPFPLETKEIKIRIVEI